MRGAHAHRNDAAVSEVIGVVMLLAMVVTMMGGVFLVLTPYVNDFQDNTSWSNANGIAERLDSRIDVVASSNEDMGLRTTVNSLTSSISPILNAEIWTVSADLTPTESVFVTYINQTAFSIHAINESAVKATVWSPAGEQTVSFNASYEPVIIDHNVTLQGTYIVSVYNNQDQIIHKHMQASLSGLMVRTSVQTGEHSIAVLNDARYDKFSGEPWDVSIVPDMKIEELFDGTMRASFSLRNVDAIGALPNGRNAVFDIQSLGPVDVFSGDAWNFRFSFQSELGPTITPMMNEGWLIDYNLHKVSDTLDEYRGIRPWQRASGFDGLTIDHPGQVIDLEIDLQLVEVSK